MAIKNTNGNYLKIKNIQIDRLENYYIWYDIFESENVRNNGLSEYEKTIESFIETTDFTFNTNKSSSKENLLTGGYLTLKQNGFNDWTDC